MFRLIQIGRRSVGAGLLIAPLVAFLWSNQFEVMKLAFSFGDPFSISPAIRPGRRPASIPFDQQALRAHFDHRHHQSRVRRMANRLRRRQDDHRAARQAHPSLRDRRNWKRVLALQKPLSKLKPKSPITRTWFALCNPGQRRAIQVLIVNMGGQFWTPIRGQLSAPIDKLAKRSSHQGGLRFDITLSQ